MAATTSHLQELLDYHQWACERMAALIDAIPDAWLDQPCSGSFESIRSCALHLSDAERIWLERLQGASTNDWPSRRRGAVAHPLGDVVRRSNQDFLRHAKAQSAAWWASWCSFTDLSGKRHRMVHRGIVQHVVNHSSYHRGQLVVQLRSVSDLAEIGNAPSGECPPIPGTDFITFLREQQPKHPDADPDLERVYGA